MVVAAMGDWRCRRATRGVSEVLRVIMMEGTMALTMVAVLGGRLASRAVVVGARERGGAVAGAGGSLGFGPLAYT